MSLINFTASINMDELIDRVNQLKYYNGEQRRRDETIELLEEISRATTEDSAINAIDLSIGPMSGIAIGLRELGSMMGMYVMANVWGIAITSIDEITSNEKTLFDTSDRGISYYRYPIDPDKVNALIDKALVK